MDLRLDPDGEDLLFGYDTQLRAAQIDFEKPTTTPRPSGPAHVPDPTLNLEDIVGPSSRSLPTVMGNADGFANSIQKGYTKDNLFSKVLSQPSHFPKFRWEKDLLYFYQEDSLPALYIPQTLHHNRKLTEMVLRQAHETLGHAGAE